jgi:peroxiredoxin
VSYNLDTAENEGLKKLKALSEKAQAKGYTVIGLSASGETAIANINATYDLNFEFYLCDEKALKTVVRSNPGVLELNQGTVQQKVHWNDIDNLDL